MRSSPIPTFLTLLSGDGPPQEAANGDRDHVLDAAVAAFTEFGIRRTSMDEIARRSGVSPASLYRWFGGKDDLVFAVLARDARHFAADLGATIDRDAPPEEQLTEATVRVARRLRSTPLFARLVETEPESILPQLTVDAAPLIEGGVDLLATHIRRLIDEGSLVAIDPVPVAEILVRVIHSLLLTRSTSLPLDDDEQLRVVAGNTIRWLLHGPDSTRPEG